MKTAIAIITAILIAGCTSTAKDFLKALESRAYDTAAKGVTEYCQRISLSSRTSSQARALVDRERVEARREIRQRGRHGPNADDGNQGPVVVIWCEGDELPEGWEKYLDKGE